MDLPAQTPLILREKNGFKKEFPGISEDCRDRIDWTAHDRNIKIQSALHGGDKKKIGSHKVDGFCEEVNTECLNFMVIIGMHTLIFFLMRTPNTQLESMMTKIKLIFTVKEIRDYDRQRLQYLQDRGYNVEIIWESNWNALVENRPEIKTYSSQLHTFTHFKKTLTQDRPNYPIYSQGTFIWVCRM